MNMSLINQAIQWGFPSSGMTVSSFPELRFILTRISMTPHECFNTQGYPSDFKLPVDMSDARLYKQAGNSVCVSVIHRIAENIVNAIK